MERLDCEKDLFHNQMASKWDLQNHDKMILVLRDFNGHVRKRIDGFENAEVNVKFSKQHLSEEDYSSFVIKKNCLWQTYCLEKGAEKNKIQYWWK